MRSNSDIPAIRTFQMDGSTAGNLRSSVNLFRGDVNYTEHLFTLPGKQKNDGLEIKISLQYQSNVNQNVTTWNRDQPTGIVGLGWDLQTPVITLAPTHALTPGAKSYSFSNNGISSQMVQEPETTALFRMDSSLANQLVNGQEIPESIRNEFQQRGLPVSSSAVISGSGSQWLIDDATLQQQFHLNTTSTALVASDGGESYQLTNYNFWKFIYYPKYERWAVISDAGFRMSFGGVDQTTSQGYRTSAGNSVEWGVCWSTGEGSSRWVGSSSEVSGQQQYARAWRLQSAYSLFGDKITYAYNEWPRGENGLIPVVEQAVGEGGKPYTKACYLTSITDAFGRKAQFGYADKEWSDSTDDSPREYSDPHKPVPNNDPNGFQDQYQTYYLDQIQLKDQDDNLLFTTVFSYEVQNIGNASGDFAKRLLTGFAMQNPEQRTLPGFLFSYAADTGTNPGALETITWPTGGQSTYGYTSLPLTQCDRSFESTPPSPISTGTPKVWFGEDYAVVNWVDTEQLSLEIMTWTGQWLVWHPPGDNALLTDQPVLESSVDVTTGKDFVAITYQTANDTQLFLYRKDPAQPGQWIAAAIEGGGSGTFNSPTKSYSNDDGEVGIQAGSNFVLVSQLSAAQNKGGYDRFSWHWSSRSWEQQSFNLDSYTDFGVGSEYYTTLDLNGNLSMFYIDASQVWQTGGTLTLEGFPASSDERVSLQGGSATVAISHLQSQNSTRQTYDLFIVRWDGNYQFADPVKHTYTDNLDAKYPTTWIPTVIEDSLVAVAGHLLRYNGEQWLTNDSLMPTRLNTGWEQRYAYNSDYAVLVYVNASNGAAEGTLLAFDANTDISSWDAEPTTIEGLTTPDSHRKAANWPAANNGDYLTVGDLLFFRGASANWATQVSSPIADIQSEVNKAGGSGSYRLNSESMINEGPQFLACSVYDQQSSTDTQVAVLVLKNGNVYQSAQILDDASIWTQASGGSPQGQYPSGPAAFASFPDTYSEFSQAQRFTINRYAADAIKGNIEHYAVTAIDIHDGLSECSNNTFLPDADTASCDPTGNVVKYYQNVVYPGGTAENHPYGTVENQYLNGNEIVTGDNYYNMLDGLLYQVVTKDADGNVLSQKTNVYQAFTERSSDPTDMSAPVKYLYGAYVLQTEEQTVEDGVCRHSVTSYIPPGLNAPFTGQPASTSAPTWNSSGSQDTLGTKTLYACEVDEASRVLNVLSMVVYQNNSIIPSGNSSAVTTSASVTTLGSWPCKWGDGVKVPCSNGNYGWLKGSSDFPFDEYDSIKGASSSNSPEPRQAPTGWQITSQITNRLTDGTLVERLDGSGTPESIIYSTHQGLPVAHFSGADLDECRYIGFEAYENISNWNLQNVTFNTDDAHTGSRSGVLSANSDARLSTSASMAAGRKNAVLGYWLKTDKGYQANGSAWKIEGGQQTQTVDFESTDGQWRYFTVGIPLNDNGSASDITVTANNSASQDALLDGVVLMPVNSDLVANTWDAAARLLLATTDQGGRTTTTSYDSNYQPLGSVGPDNQLQELSIRFLSRQGSSDGLFNSASPNAELTLHAAECGTLESFRDGGAWQQRWQASDSGAWSEQGGRLLFNGQQSSALSWKGWTEPPATAAFFAEILATDLNETIGIQFGDGQKILWTPGVGWQWQNSQGQSVQSPLNQPPQVATQWLLLIGDQGLVQFYGDGQLLFSQKNSVTPEQGFVLLTGSNTFSLLNLASAGLPRLGIAYNDGASRQRQIHQLHQNDSYVMELIYDALDRQIANTRVAPASFGQGSHYAPMQYRSTFVNVPDFIAAIADSWKMAGDVSDYYNGQSEGPVARADDQGYPYSGIRYEASSRNRQIENGQPGLLLAIHDIQTTTPAERHTTKTDYGASSGEDPMPAGKFYAKTTTTASGYEGQRFVDTANRLVANVQLNTEGGNVGESAVTMQYSQNSGTSSTLKLPNAFTTSPQQDPASYQRSQLQNPLSQVVTMTDADSGTMEYLYDGKGNIRFTRVALDEGEQYFLYSRFDGLGRMVEEGYVNSPWDASKLADKVNDQAWPAATDNAVICRSYQYDGDGNCANSLGQLLQVTTLNQWPDQQDQNCRVTQSWQYDGSGRVQQAYMKVEGAAAQEATVNYTYNNVNEVASITFADNVGSSLQTIVYQHNDQGQVTGIGSCHRSPTNIAAYSYNSDGAVETERLGEILNIFTYTSPGQLENQQSILKGSQVFSQDTGYNYDGLVQSRARKFAFSEYSNDRDITYRYDGQQRLSDAMVANSQAGGETIGQYDANGNIWQISRDGQSSDSTMVAGNNQLETVTLSTGDTLEFKYKANGSPSQWRGIGLSYDRGTGALVQAVSGSSTVRFARGINNQLILRQQGNENQIRFYGAGDTPLVTFGGGQPVINIWGPTGIAAFHNGAIRYPIKDSQRTLWGVTDSAGKLVAYYDYYPFGGIVSQGGSEVDQWPAMFMGKPYDSLLQWYDFSSRVYDPLLCRFMTPDPSRQYASPYLFNSNSPLNFTDPSGNISVWAQVGIALTTAAIAIVGIALTPFTGGASDATAASLDASLVGAEVGAEVGEEVVASGVTVAAESAEATEAGATAATLGQNISYVAQQAAFSALSGAGISGFTYDVTHGRDFTAKGFFTAVGIGAAAGAVSGGLGGLASAPSSAASIATQSITRQILIRMVAQGTASMIGSDLKTILTDVASGKKITLSDLLISSAEGFASGAASGAFSAVKGIKPGSTGVNALENKVVSASTTLNRAIDAAKSAATTQTAIAVYMVGGFNLVGAYAAWGVYENGQSNQGS